MTGVILFVRGDLIERGNGKPGYDWKQGYNEMNPDNGCLIFPGMTRREAQTYAKAQGKKAKFIERGEKV